MVRYQDCSLMGYRQVHAGTGATTAGKLLYDGCRLYGQSAATGGSGFLQWTVGVSDCMAGSSRLPDTQSP
ncbi:hypothetical protein [Streptomyces sp. NPDC057375]|uniref:hypothetical protein n=1 Tax=Streptomyces sp. NPDC057375 TaxID=3346109 RepID=UPI0036327F60